MQKEEEKKLEKRRVYVGEIPVVELAKLRSEAANTGLLLGQYLRFLIINRGKLSHRK